MTEPRNQPPKQVIFDTTPEIHATDTAGGFSFPLTEKGQAYLQTVEFDEIRFVFSLWHPSSSRTIDHDRSYVEVRASLAQDDEHWVKITEVEPVVAPYGGGDTFDGWVVLPILSGVSAFSLHGSGFEPRARLQIRASAYLVA